MDIVTAHSQIAVTVTQRPLWSASGQGQEEHIWAKSFPRARSIRALAIEIALPVLILKARKEHHSVGYGHSASHHVANMASRSRAYGESTRPAITAK